MPSHLCKPWLQTLNFRHELSLLGVKCALVIFSSHDSTPLAPVWIRARPNVLPTDPDPYSDIANLQSTMACRPAELKTELHGRFHN